MVLEPFAEITTRVQSESLVTASLVVQLAVHLNDHLKNMKPYVSFTKKSLSSARTIHSQAILWNHQTFKSRNRFYKRWFFGSNLFYLYHLRSIFQVLLDQPIKSSINHECAAETIFDTASAGRMSIDQWSFSE